MTSSGGQIDPEFPGVSWIRTSWILHCLKDGERLPRHQDLPAAAFGSRATAQNVYAVTHPWLARWQPDPNGIQVETLRAKLDRMNKNFTLEKDDVLFFDYLSLPQINADSGEDDRTGEEKERFKRALTGDLMGRIFLTSNVLIIDEVPKDAISNVQYLDRGWCYFECCVAALNVKARDTMWVDKAVKDEIARFRTLSAEFRDTGGFGPLLEEFESGLEKKQFSNSSDADMVRGFFVSLAHSQRLVRAAARGDWDGCEQALDAGADTTSRDGWGRTALHAAVLNGRVSVVAKLLQILPQEIAQMKSIDNETIEEVAKQSGVREIQLLVKRKISTQTGVEQDATPDLTIRTIERDLGSVEELLDESGGKNTAVDEPDDQGFTSLYYAVSLGYQEITDVLLKHGADPHLQCGPDDGAESTLDLARRLGLVDLEKILAKYGEGAAGQA